MQFQPALNLHSVYIFRTFYWINYFERFAASFSPCPFSEQFMVQRNCKFMLN